MAGRDLNGFTLHRLYSQPFNDCKLATKSLCPENITDYINKGVGFASYIGHGSPLGWAIPNGGYLLEEVDKLTNSDKLPVIFAVACSTGAFTTVPPITAYTDINGKTHSGTDNKEVFTSTPPQPACIQEKDLESMAEKMTVMKVTGAVAYAGSAITGHDESLDLHRFFSNPSEPIIIRPLVICGSTCCRSTIRSIFPQS